MRYQMRRAEPQPRPSWCARAELLLRCVFLFVLLRVGFRRFRLGRCGGLRRFRFGGVGLGGVGFLLGLFHGLLLLGVILLGLVALLRGFGLGRRGSGGAGDGGGWWLWRRARGCWCCGRGGRRGGWGGGLAVGTK